MNPETMIAKWVAEAKLRSGTSLRMIEAHTGISRSKLSSISKGRASLSLRESIDLCEFLGRDLCEAIRPAESAEARIYEKLLSIAEEQVRQPSLDNVARWLRECGGHIDPAHRFFQHLVLVDLPRSTDSGISVSLVGGKSMTCEVLGAPDCSGAEGYVMGLKPVDRAALKASYQRLDTFGDMSTFSRVMKNPGGDVIEDRLEYLTLLSRCKLPDGSEKVCNLSKLVSRINHETGVREVA